MKKTRIAAIAAATIMALASIIGCSRPEEVVRPSSVSITPSSAALTVGETVNLKAAVSPSGCEYSSIKWSSSDTKVATVNEGLVVALSPGNATISASADGVVGKAEITVAAKYIAVERVVVKDADGNTDGSLHVSETVQLRAELVPADATDRAIRWEATTKYASVDENGKVTALAIGDCTIRAYAAGGVFGEYYCKIDPVLISSMKIVDPDGNEEGKAHVGGTLQLKAVIEPENASFQDLVWSSSDENIASVDENGLVSLKKVGSADITAVAGSSSIDKTVAVYKLTVDAVNVTSITVAPETVSVVEGKTVQLEAVILPENASIKKVTWLSSDKSVALVDENGLVTALKPGMVKVYASSLGDPGIFGTCTVTVEPDRTLVGISITPGEMGLQVGQTKSLSVSFIPEYAANKNLIWSSSDPSVASVVDGSVTGLKDGVSVITATSEEGSFTASCKVTVTAGLPEGTKVFYGDSNSAQLYMNEDIYFDKVYRFTVSGQDLYSYYRYDGNIYKNREKLFSIREMLGPDDDFYEMKVVGHHLYVSMSTGTTGKEERYILKVDMSTLREEKIHFMKEPMSYVYKLDYDVSRDGTIYVLGHVEDQTMERSSRLWTIHPDGETEEKVLFRANQSALDSNGNNLLDAYETSIYSIDVDGNGDVYYQVYIKKVQSWESLYNVYLYKNDKLMRVYDHANLISGCGTIVVKGGDVYEALPFYDLGKSMYTFKILKNGETLYSDESSRTPSFYGLKVDADGSAYYAYNHKVYKDGKLLYDPGLPFITAIDIMD